MCSSDLFGVEARRDHTGDQLPERAEARAAEHASKEAVGERHEHPHPTGGKERHGLSHHTGSHEACRRFVDRVGEAEPLRAHAPIVSTQFPIGNIGIYFTGYGRGMPLRLTVDRAAWHQHVSAQVSSYGNALIPVVKGSGHGLGRSTLHEWLHQHLPGTMPAVGTIHEAPQGPALVLTPVLHAPVRTDLVLTVGCPEHVAALAGWRGSVVVKLQSSMRRYGTTPTEFTDLLAAATRQGLHVAALALHLPLAGTDTERLAEVEAWLPHLAHSSHELWLSHLEPASLRSLAALHPQHTFRIRVGTRLWQGIPVKEMPWPAVTGAATVEVLQ